MEQYDILLKPFDVPRVEGNIVVEINDEGYQKGVEDTKYSVVGRLSLQKVVSTYYLLFYGEMKEHIGY